MLRNMICSTGYPFPLLLVALLLAAVSAIDESRFTDKAIFSADYTLRWRVNASEGNIYLAVRARTSGFVGLGFSEVGAMVGSDIIIGYVSNGMATVSDRFAFNKSRDASGIPSLDEQQDVRVVAGEEAVDSNGDTWTTLEYVRALDTGDVNDRPIREGEYVQVIWSMGSSDNLGYHGTSRGGAAVLFFGVSNATVAPPADVVDFYNITTKDYVVPANFTTYACNVFNVPFTQKQHAVGWGVIINTNAPQAVHHAVVYTCDQSTTGPPIPTAPNFGCEQNPYCSTTLAVWAVGGRPFYLPKIAGLPFGPGGHTKLVLQIHYTNPDGRSDIVDSSGIFFSMAKKLRQEDAGLLAVGPVNYKEMIRIPAGQPSWTLVNECPSVCTEKALAKSGGISIVGSYLHLHTKGRQLFTDLYRNGSKVASLGRQDYYDFASQQAVEFGPFVDLRPGDMLRTTCVWDTSDATNVTVGGPSTREEMCINYLVYYPYQRKQALNGDGCYSACVAVSPNFKDARFSPVPGWPTYQVALCSDSVSEILSANCSFDYGQSVAFQSLAGDAAKSVTLLPSNFSSAPASPAPTSTPSPSSCALSFGGSNRQFTSCQSMEGGFQLYWSTDNATRQQQGSNTSISFALSVSHNGWAGFGISPQGGMVGSSAIVGFPTDNGVTVNQYYLGDKVPTAVVVGGALSASGLQGEYQDGKLTTLFTLSLPSAQANADLNVVWAKGTYDASNGDQLTQHASQDAHPGTIRLTNATATSSKGASRRRKGGLVSYVSMSAITIAICVFAQPVQLL